MGTFFDDASLVMIPSGVKESKLYSIKPTDGTGDFTFTRGTDTATRVNSAGLIEKETQNLLTRSNTFSDSDWSKSNSITFTSGQSGYDGTNAAWSATPPASSGNSAFYQNNTSNLATSSIYAKYNGYHLRIRVGGTGGNRAFATFDLQNGTIGNSGGTAFVDAEITSIGSGWYRCSLTKNYSTAGFAEFQISENATDGDNPSWTPNGTSGIYIQDAQLEQSLVARTYIETTTAAVYAGITDNLPRLDYSGGASCPALLLEPQRTNLITNSEYLNGSAWTLNNVTITDNDAISPEGVQNASKWVAASGFSLKSIYPLLTSTIGVAYTATGYFKADEYPLAFIRLGGISGNPYILYNLSTQSMVATSGLTSYDIESVGNDWYRIQATATATSTLIAPNYCFLPASGYTLNVNNIPEYTGDGTSGGHLYGAQLESGSYPTSYIPTMGVSATRAKEGAQVTSVSDLIGQTQGTLFAEVDSFGVGESANRILCISNGTSAERVIMLTRSNGFRFIVTNSSSNNVDYTNYTTTNGVHKLAMTYDANEVRIFLDGAKVTTDSSVTLPSLLNSVHIGKVEITDSYNNNFGGSAKQALVFKTALTDAECITLTTL